MRSDLTSIVPKTSKSSKAERKAAAKAKVPQQAAKKRLRHTDTDPPKEPAPPTTTPGKDASSKSDKPNKLKKDKDSKESKK